MWEWVSTSPGITTFPERSRTSAPGGTATRSSGPTAAMRPSTITMEPEGMASPSTGMMRAPRRTRGGAGKHGDAAASRTAAADKRARGNVFMMHPDPMKRCAPGRDMFREAARPMDRRRRRPSGGGEGDRRCLRIGMGILRIPAVHPGAAGRPGANPGVRPRGDSSRPRKESFPMWRRIVNLFRGFLGLFITGMEKSNPKALLEVEKENLRKQVARFNESLASHAGFCERLMRQVKNLESQERDLAAKAAAHLKAGNTAVAGQYALQLRTVKEQLEENRSQLGDAEKTYKDLEKARDVSVSEARVKIEKLSRMISET